MREIKLKRLRHRNPALHDASEIFVIITSGQRRRLGLARQHYSTRPQKREHKERSGGRHERGQMARNASMSKRDETIKSRLARGSLSRKFRISTREQGVHRVSTCRRYGGESEGLMDCIGTRHTSTVEKVRATRPRRALLKR